VLCIVLTACAGANANTSGASSEATSGASSADSSGTSRSSTDASQGSADSSAGSGQSSADSSASSNASLDGTSGSTDNASTEATAAGTSRNSSDATSEASGSGQNAADPNLSAVVAGSALLLSTVVGIGFAIYGSVRAMEDPRHPGSARATAMYLSAQTHQLEQDLALGAGPVLDDLAAAAGVPAGDRPRFGKLLRAHRGELLELAERRLLTPERALRFLNRVGELTWADPVLNVSARRVLERTGGQSG